MCFENKIRYIQAHLNDGLVFFRIRYGLSKIKLNINSSEKVYTDGQSINIGLSCPIMKLTTNGDRKLLCLYGFILHELGHLLYTSFSSLKAAVKSVGAGCFYPCKPDNITKEIEDGLSNMKFRSMLLSMYHFLGNVLEDGRIENLLFTGPCRGHAKYINGLSYVRRLQWNAYEDITEKIQQYEDEKDEETKERLKYEALFSGIFSLAKYSNIKGSEGAKDHEIMKDILLLSGYISDATCAESSDEMYSACNHIFCAIYEKYIAPLLKESDDGEKSAESKEESEEENPLEDALEKLSAKYDIGENQEQSSKTDEIEEATIDAKDSVSQSGEANANDSEHDSSKGSSSLLRDSVCAPEDIKETGTVADAVASQLENEDESREKELSRMRKEIDSAGEVPLGDENEGVVFITNEPETDEDEKALYRLYQESVDAGLDAAERLKDTLKGSKVYFDPGHYFGQRLNRRLICKPGLKYFDRKIEIQGSPTISLAVLIDQSGSMYEEKLNYVRKAAIMLYEMCYELDIPYGVFGHCAYYPNVYMDIYSYFGEAKVNSDAKYRLLSISSRCANRDGAALRYVANLLSKQNTKMKLLVLISDGLPSDFNYGGDAARNDIRECIEEYEAKGIKFISCAIDEDREQIEEIYGKERFLSVSDLNSLPGELADIIARLLQ